MKMFKLAALFSALAVSTATAGSTAAPYMEPEIVVEEAASSSAAGWIIPLIFLAIVLSVGTREYSNLTS